MSKKVRIMFLGGSLDHAIREVEAHPTSGKAPLNTLYKVTRKPRPVPEGSGLDPDPAEEIYIARQLASGPYVWFVYILHDYSPPRSHVIDSNPYPFARN